MSDSKQSLAMAYDMKKRNKRKKMAKGGMVNESAASEQRPMPSEEDKDSAMISRQSEGSPMPRPPKMQPMKHPSMAQSPVFKVKMRDEEDHIESSMPPQKHQGMSSDKGPSEEEYMAKHFAEGGRIDEETDDTIRPDKGWGRVIIKGAEGGMIDDEMQMDHADSIASAIMARRERKMMAEGGAVDIDSNGEEQPNGFDDRNEAILKENYDSDMDDVSQPMDSNEHDISISADEHDMVSKIRSQMNRKRQFKAK